MYMEVILSPSFDLNATAYALQERESGRLGRRLGLVELEGCESGAFVDRVAEDERLLSQWSAFYISLRWRVIAAGCTITHHFSNQSTLKTSSIVSKQSDIINNRTEPGYPGTVPDDTVESIVRSLLHANKLVLSMQAIAAELLGQDCESCCVGRVELADRSGLCYDAGDDGIFGVGVAVGVCCVASGGLTPEDHVVWIATGGCVSEVATGYACRVYSPEGFDVLTQPFDAALK